MTFRAAGSWRSAERALAGGLAVPVYITPVGESKSPEVQYQAELCEIQLHPRSGDPEDKATSFLQHEFNQGGRTV